MHVQDTGKKLGSTLRSYNTRSTFHTESTLRKLLCQTKEREATADKSNIAHEIECSNCEAVYFGESKRSLKSHSDEHKHRIPLAVGNHQFTFNTLFRKFETLSKKEIKMMKTQIL